MRVQNYSNHKKYVFGYHILTLSLSALLLFFSVYELYMSIKNNENIQISSMYLIVSILFILLFYYSRIFALKAQDRAIRAEENLRYFILTGRGFDQGIRLSQILALRFASDEEFVLLTEKALLENLNSNQIKKNIKNWKGDYYRV